MAFPPLKPGEGPVDKDTFIATSDLFVADIQAAIDARSSGMEPRLASSTACLALLHCLHHRATDGISNGLNGAPIMAAVEELLMALARATIDAALAAAHGGKPQ